MAGVNMTQEQKKAAMQVLHLGRIFCDSLYRIMKNHGLLDVKGSRLQIIISPEFGYADRYVGWGVEGSDAGICELTRGEKFHDGILTVNRYSAEYEGLLDRTADLTSGTKIKSAEKPLPPDGMWVSAHDDVPFVDRGV